MTALDRGTSKDYLTGAGEWDPEKDEEEAEKGEEKPTGDDLAIAIDEDVVLDESVLAQNIDNIEIVKEEVKEEVSFAVEKIPVVIKPRKKRGRPKKKQ